MALLDYTTYEDIRAALGVSNDELEDSTLSLEVYEGNLTLELEDVSLALQTEYATVAALTTRTDAQTRFYDAARLFSTYAVAKHASVTLPMFSPKDIGDGKALVSRWADSPYKTTIKEVEKMYDRLKNRLAQAFAAYQSTSTTSVVQTFMVVSSPSTNPVTGS